MWLGVVVVHNLQWKCLRITEAFSKIENENPNRISTEKKLPSLLIEGIGLTKNYKFLCKSSRFVSTNLLSISHCLFQNVY